MTAARAGAAAVVTALVDRGADVNAKEPTRGQTALMLAAAEQHPEAIRVLIQRGADVHARSVSGSTALLLAARDGDVETARSLIEGGARANDAANDGLRAAGGHGPRPDRLRGTCSTTAPTPTHDRRIHGAAGQRDLGDSADRQVRHPGIEEWGALGGLRGAAKVAFVKQLLAHGADQRPRRKTPPLFGTSFSSHCAANCGRASVCR
jgi:ankyrin repeat protein